MKSKAQPARKHHGGTLTGFVVGLLVGLAVALSVAVYVTRVPVPFVDRGVSRKPAQDAIEAEHNKGWNPNGALVAKPAPLPTPEVAQPVEAPAAETVPEKAPAAAASAADTPAKPATPASKPAADPLGDLMRARTGQATEPASTSAAAPAAAPAGPDPFAYFVQVGAFKSAEDAQAQKARLALLGMSADISEREQAGRTVYRVRLGPFNQKGMAEATREQLETNGVEAAMVRVQR